MEHFEAAQRRALSVLAERAPGVAAIIASADGSLAASAARVLALSDFVLDALCRDPELWQRLLRAAQPALSAALAAPELPAAEEIASSAAELRFMAGLGRRRRAEVARIAWRDLAGWGGL